jgi:hypothetical protein
MLHPAKSREWILSHPCSRQRSRPQANRAKVSFGMSLLILCTHGQLNHRQKGLCTNYVRWLMLLIQRLIVMPSQGPGVGS